MVNRRSVKGIFRFLIKDDGFPFLQKSWNSTWWIKLISQQARFWELFIKSPALWNTKNISFLFQFYSKKQKKGTFYNFKCKRFLKLMTLSVYRLCGLAPTIRTLFPVRCKSCFILFFLTKSYHFNAFLFLIYMVSKLVYPNCTQFYITPSLYTVLKKFISASSLFAFNIVWCSVFFNQNLLIQLISSY
jgi:hypothetical protein